MSHAPIHFKRLLTKYTPLLSLLAATALHLTDTLDTNLGGGTTTLLWYTKKKHRKKGAKTKGHEEEEDM